MQSSMQRSQSTSMHQRAHKNPSGDLVMAKDVLGKQNFTKDGGKVVQVNRMIEDLRALVPFSNESSLKLVPQKLKSSPELEG